MDPYVVVTYKDEEFRTKVHKDGGKKPLWDFSFEIKVNSFNDVIEFDVMDENMISDSKIGSVKVMVGTLCKNNAS